VATRRECCRFRGEERGGICLAFSPDGRALATGSLDVTVLLWDLTGRRQGPQGRLRPARLAPAELQALWADLKREDSAAAWSALWKMTAAPESVPFLKEMVRPIPRLDARLSGRLIAELGSAQFTVREKASQELQKLGEATEPALRKALEGTPPLEVRRRLERQLEELARWTPERLRVVRSLAVLEQAATPEARAVLQSLAAGSPGTWLTREADAALQRLARHVPGPASSGR
jgi:hypothetical protein